ncbi:MAG: hypothetical protein U0792_11675 [Gemmataceae bacterium]
MGIVYLATRKAHGFEVAVKAVNPGEETLRSRNSSRAKPGDLGQVNHLNIVRSTNRVKLAAPRTSSAEHRLELTWRSAGFARAPRVEGERRSASQSRYSTRWPTPTPGDSCTAILSRRTFAGRGTRRPTVQVKLRTSGWPVYRAAAISGLTHIGDLGGTPAYMPPEQITNYREVMPAADQYSTAAMLYHADGELGARSSANARGPADDLEQGTDPTVRTRPDLPKELSDALHVALAKQAADRYPDVTAFRQPLVPFGR